MKSTNVALLVFVVAFLLQACTLEKRRYMHGWHVDWTSSDRSGSTRQQKQELQPADMESTRAELMCPEDLPCKDTAILNLTTTDTVSFSAVNAIPIEHKTKRERSHKPSLANMSKAFAHGSVAEIAENHSTKTGEVFGNIAIMLLTLAFLFCLTGLLFNLGWSSLGLIIVGIFIAACSMLFALVSWIVLRANDEVVPLHVWIVLGIGGLAALLIAATFLQYLL